MITWALVVYVCTATPYPRCPGLKVDWYDTFVECEDEKRRLDLKLLQEVGIAPHRTACLPE